MQLREEVEAAVRAAIESGGLNAVSSADIVRRFIGRGTSERTLYRWVQCALTSGIAMATLPPSVSPSGATATEAVASTAAPSSARTVPAAAISRGSGIAVLDLLQECIGAATQVMKYARKDDGSVRNAKLLVGASEHLRRNLDTAVKLRESMRQDQDLDRFLADVVAEVERESPECARRIMHRLDAMLTVNGF